jgi:hypothetical protein
MFRKMALRQGKIVIIKMLPLEGKIMQWYSTDKLQYLTLREDLA